jgi:arylsulfatase A-like enzyme
MKLLLALSFIVQSSCSLFAVQSSKPPNILLISMDDMGYGDLACFGSKKNRTPHLDRMAAEGIRFTDFYVTSGVCTPSRASLMTGCYPRRVNLHVDENDKWVLFPAARKGLNPDEITLPEILQKAGYATTCIGKWHLGDHPDFLPTRHGFDSYFGIPYSNDMGRKNIPLPLMRDEEVIEAPVQQASLTRRYTDEAIAFITQNKDKPFFLYLPHTCVHLPLFPGEKFKGTSANGKYGDWIQEVDTSTGELLQTLKDFKLDKNTLVIFTSDNGSNARNGGSNAPLKGTKGSTHEGGMRVPCLMRWPGTIPAGKTCAQLASTLDLLPTLSSLAGASVPTDRKIDGLNITDLILAKEGAQTPRNSLFYYHTTQLQAVRSGKWKLVLPRKVRFDGWSGKKEDTSLELYDLSVDPGESTDIAAKHPDVVERLRKLARQAQEELGDGPKEGSGQRPAGWVDQASPRLLR